MFNRFRRTPLVKSPYINESPRARAWRFRAFGIGGRGGRFLSFTAVSLLLNFSDTAVSCLASDIRGAKINSSNVKILLAQGAAQVEHKSPLQGKVDDAELLPKKVSPSLPFQPLVPVLPKATPIEEGKEEKAKLDESVDQPMSGKIDQSSLKGSEWTSDDSDVPLKPLTATAAPSGTPLKGGARIEDSELEGEDPDAQDQELQVEWDKWRNRFLQAVLSGAMDNLNNPQESDLRFDPRTQRITIQFPLGTIAWFSCKITNDRQIKNLKLDQSSGYPNYDNAVLNAVHDLAGTIILQFPRRSRRVVVSQNGGVKTSDHTEQQYFRFGDVERYRVPGS